MGVSDGCEGRPTVDVAGNGDVVVLGADGVPLGVIAPDRLRELIDRVDRVLSDLRELE
jgi:hypothetical protein